MREPGPAIASSPQATIHAPSTGSSVAVQPSEGPALPESQTGIIVVVALVAMLAPLNSTMIVVALSLVIKYFHTDVASAGWLVTAYLIVMASCQPIAGKLGDRLGRRTLILVGLLYFAAASLGAGLAPNLVVLIIFRVQQAIAASVALPNAFALIRDVVPTHRRASMYGMTGAASGLAAAMGPPTGGLVATIGGWRAIFLVNVLLVGPALILGWKVLPRVARQGGRRFDLIGAGWLLCILTALALSTTFVRQMHSPLLAATAFLALLGLIAAFLRRQYGHPDPVFQPRLFGRRSFAASNAAIALSNLAMYTALLAVPILLARETHLSTAQVGLVLASLTATNLIVSPLGGRLADRYGRRWPSVVGMAVLTVAFIPLAIISGPISLPLLIPCLAAIGLGIGVCWAGLQTASVESVDPRDAGSASGIFSTSRYLGSIVGASLLAAILSAHHGGSGGFQLAFSIMLVASLGAGIAALFLQDHPAAHVT